MALLAVASVRAIARTTKTIFLPLATATATAAAIATAEPKLGIARTSVNAVALAGVTPAALSVSATTNAKALAWVLPPALNKAVASVDADAVASMSGWYARAVASANARAVASITERPLPVAIAAANAWAFAKLVAPANIYDFALITNTDTAGFSQYNWPVDEVVGELGISESGVYSLQGSDDNGTEIDAHLELPWLALGEGQVVRVADIMALARSEGDMELKIGMIENGEGWRYCYTVQCNGANLNDLYVKTGRGMRSHLVNARLDNKEGKDFVFNDLTFRFVRTARRRFT